MTMTVAITSPASHLDFHALPSNIKREVLEHLAYERRAYAHQQCRFFENHGFESASAYRLHLIANYKTDSDLLESTIQGTVVEHYKEHGKTEPWMVPVLNKYPQLLADSLHG